MAVRFDADGEDYTRTTGLPSATTFTVCMWLCLDVDRDTYSCILSLDAGTGSFVFFETDSDGTTLKGWENDDGLTDGAPSISLTVGTWAFVAFVRNGTGANSLTAYWANAGAASLSTGQRTLDQTVTPTTLRIGESPWGGEWWNGRIAALKIWDGVTLTQAEIENERFQYLPCRTANLNSFYPFLNGGAVAEARQDFSGNGNNLSAGTNSATADGPPIPWRLTLPKTWMPPFALTGGYYLLENGTDKFLLEDASGKLILEETTGGGAFTITPTGTITPAGALIKQGQKALSGTITPAGSLIKSISKLLTGGITPTGALTTLKLIVRSFTGTITPAGNLIKQAQKLLTGSITPSGAILKQAQKRFAGTITPTGALTTIKAILRTFTGSITPSGNLIRQTGKALSGSLTPSGSLIKSVSKRFAGTITPSGALTVLKLVLRTFTGSITPIGALRKQISKGLAGSITPVGSLLKSINKLFSGIITLAGNFLSFVIPAIAPNITVRVGDQAVTAASGNDSAVISAALSDSRIGGALIGDSRIGSATISDAALIDSSGSDEIGG